MLEISHILNLGFSLVMLQSICDHKLKTLQFSNHSTIHCNTQQVELVIKCLAAHLIKRQNNTDLSMENSLYNYGHYKDPDWT